MTVTDTDPFGLPPLSNNPPDDVEILRDRLKETTAEMFARAARLADAVDRIPAPIPDDETAAKVSALVGKQILPHVKMVEAVQKEEKRPFADLANAAFSFFSPTLARLDAAKKKANGLLLAFDQEKRRLADEARRLAEREAQRKAEEARKLADAAKSDADLDRAIAAEEHANTAATAAAAIIAPGPIRSDYGSTSSARRTVDYAIESLDHIPRRFLVVNDAAIRALTKTAPKGQLPAAVPGIRWLWKETMVSRG